MKTQNVRNSRGPYKKSSKTRAKFIDSGIEVLTEEGYGGFSLRKVARKAGVSIGNLQHHFGSKQKLVDTMMECITAEYFEDFERLIALTKSPRNRLRRIIKLVVKDLKRKETTLLFPELWSMANHEADIQVLLDSMFNRYQNIYVEIIKLINPELSPEQVERASIFIAASLEGHLLFMGHGKKDEHQNESIAELAYWNFLHMIESGTIPDKSSDQLTMVGGPVADTSSSPRAKR